jgi:ABC-type branched-subunit amino acid transport system ATPase component
VTTLLVEHHMDLVMDISDEILVLNFGQVLAEGTPVAIRTDSRVIQAYLGDEATLARDLRS